VSYFKHIRNYAQKSKVSFQENSCSLMQEPDQEGASTVTYPSSKFNFTTVNVRRLSRGLVLRLAQKDALWIPDEGNVTASEPKNILNISGYIRTRKWTATHRTACHGRRRALRTVSDTTEAAHRNQTKRVPVH
jgi:hypothetical protein